MKLIELEKNYLDQKNKLQKTSSNTNLLIKLENLYTNKKSQLEIQLKSIESNYNLLNAKFKKLSDKEINGRKLMVGN